MNLTHFTLIWAQLELWAIKNSIEHVQWKCPELVMFSLSAVIETSKKCAKTFLKIPRWFFPYSKQKYSFDSHKYSKNHSEHFHFFHSMVCINIFLFLWLETIQFILAFSHNSSTAWIKRMGDLYTILRHSEIVGGNKQFQTLLLWVFSVSSPSSVFHFRFRIAKKHANDRVWVRLKPTRKRHT